MSTVDALKRFCVVTLIIVLVIGAIQLTRLFENRSAPGGTTDEIELTASPGASYQNHRPRVHLFGRPTKEEVLSRIEDAGKENA